MREGRTITLTQSLAAAVEQAIGVPRFAAALAQGEAQTIADDLQAALV